MATEMSDGNSLQELMVNIPKGNIVLKDDRINWSGRLLLIISFSRNTRLLKRHICLLQEKRHLLSKAIKNRLKQFIHVINFDQTAFVTFTCNALHTMSPGWCKQRLSFSF